MFFDTRICSIEVDVGLDGMYELDLVNTKCQGPFLMRVLMVFHLAKSVALSNHDLRFYPKLNTDHLLKL